MAVRAGCLPLRGTFNFIAATASWPMTLSQNIPASGPTRRFWKARTSSLVGWVPAGPKEQFINVGLPVSQAHHLGLGTLGLQPAGCFKTERHL